MKKNRLTTSVFTCLFSLEVVSIPTTASEHKLYTASRFFIVTPAIGKVIAVTTL